MKFLNLLTFLISFIWVQPAISQASPVPLDLTKSVASGDLIGHMESWLDKSNAYTIEARDDMPFRVIESRGVDYGYTTGTVWLRVTIRNSTDDEDDWRILFRENFFPYLRVYVQYGSDAPLLIEKHDPSTRFRDRELAYPELLIPLKVPVGDTATVYVSYRSSGSSQTSFAIMTAGDFADRAAMRIARNFAYYGMILFLAFASGVAFLVTRSGIFAGYCAYALAVLLFLMHADGNAFRYLWPDWPRFNGFASILAGWAVIVTGANFARMFLQTRKLHRTFDLLLLAAIIAATVCVLASAVIGAQLVKKYLILLAFASILLFTLAGFNAARTRFREVRFYVLAWAGAVISSGIMTARHWLGIDISEEVQLDSMRIVTIFDAAFMGLAIVDRFNQLKRARQQALESSLSAARRSLELSNRLRELEEDFSAAQELAETRGQRISDTAHDLRQPLHALRLNVQALVNNPSNAGLKASDVEETFSYLETLVANELNAQSHSTEAPDPEHERSGVATVFKRLEEMFAPDARDKGLDLRIVPSSAVVGMSPLDLMRVASNLVSNAIKYTETGRVLVGIRHGNAGPRLEVHDTGAGMTEAAFEQARKRGERLEGLSGSVEGHGLGLSIVCRLLAARGLAIGLLPRRSRGTSIFVDLPPG